jgi:two-component system sensor histidine kinase BaeS
MRSLRARFVLSHILPLLVVIPLVGIALTYLLETQVLLAGLSNELERQAMLVAAIAVDYPQIWFDPEQAQAFTARLGERLTAQVALLSPEGVLLASTDPADQPSLGQRLEIAGLAEVLATGRVVRVDYGERPGTGAAEVLVPVFVNRQIAGVLRLTDPLSSVYARFPRTRTLILWVLVAGLAVGVGMGWVLAFGLERPLRRATQAISQMAGGEPLAVLREQGPHEIRLLLRAFNTLTQRLQSLERARTRLLANLVHELGRPLGALLSAAQALEGGADKDPALRRELVQGMEAEVQRMQRLLDELTHLYDRALGPLEMDCKQVALGPWLAQVVAPWREAARGKGLS